MKKLFRAAVLCSVVVVVLVAAPRAEAQQVVTAPFGFGAGYGLGFGPNFLLDQRPPYFALFPPVYYKHPIIARQYGYSPFAYYPYPVEPSLNRGEEPKPKTISNPYYEGTKKSESVEANEASAVARPLRIRNPYYDTSLREASSAGMPRAQRIYPTERSAIEL